MNNSDVQKAAHNKNYMSIAIATAYSSNRYGAFKRSQQTQL